MTNAVQYLRNPITDDVVKANEALAQRLRSYGWQYTNAEAYRRSFARGLTCNLLRTEVN